MIKVIIDYKSGGVAMSDEFNHPDQNQNPQQENGSPESQPYKPFNQYDTPPFNPYQQPPQQSYQQEYQQPNNPYQPPNYQQPGGSYGYQQPYQQPFSPYPVEPQPAKGLGIFSFVCSLISVICCGWIPPLGFIGLITAIVARVKGNRSGLTVAAIVLGVIGILIALYIMFSFLIVGANSALYSEFLEQFIEEYYSYY